jgi:hypothetical protein
LATVLIKCLLLLSEKDLNKFFDDFDSQRDFIYKKSKENQEKFGADFSRKEPD